MSHRHGSDSPSSLVQTMFIKLNQALPQHHPLLTNIYGLIVWDFNPYHRCRESFSFVQYKKYHLTREFSVPFLCPKIHYNVHRVLLLYNVLWHIEILVALILYVMPCLHDQPFNSVVATCSGWQGILFRETGVFHRITNSFSYLFWLVLFTHVILDIKRTCCIKLKKI